MARASHLASCFVVPCSSLSCLEGLSAHRLLPPREFGSLLDPPRWLQRTSFILTIVRTLRWRSYALSFRISSRMTSDRDFSLRRAGRGLFIV